MSYPILHFSYLIRPLLSSPFIVAAIQCKPSNSIFYLVFDYILITHQIFQSLDLSPKNLEQIQTLPSYYWKWCLSDSFNPIQFTKSKSLDEVKNLCSLLTLLGAFGAVYLCTLLGQNVAVKQMKTEKDIRDRCIPHDIFSEILILKKVQDFFSYILIFSVERWWKNL